MIQKPKSNALRFSGHLCLEIFCQGTSLSEKANYFFHQKAAVSFGRLRPAGVVICSVFAKLFMRDLKLLRQTDQNSFGAANIAELVGVFVLHDFAYELRAVFQEPGNQFVDVFNGKHNPQIT